MQTTPKDTPISVAIVYHSGYGHTKVLAQHVATGASSVPGARVDMISVLDITSEPDKLTPYDAMIFGCPTYMSSCSAPFKAFIDATSKLWVARAWKNKIAAAFTNSHSMSGDKSITLIELAAFAAQHGMIWVPQFEMNSTGGRGTDSLPSGHPDGINRLGTWLGLMGQSDDVPVTPSPGDLKTAEHFGQNVARATARWNACKP